ncbi:MAG: NUDIX hydrolase [Candidatus Bathyarchaeota archaeon]|nr:NUDIX hydrolase [Candidatus Bathyarchaeota archaeon]
MRGADAPLIGALVVVLRERGILMIERGIEPHLGYWSLPGGVIDEGESPVEATVRETLEETGLEVVVVRRLGVVTGPLTGRGHGVYLCSAVGGGLRACPPEVTDVRWVPHDGVHELMVPGFIREFLGGLDLVSLEAEP